MKKTIVALYHWCGFFIVTFGSHAQTTVKLPAKAYPVKVPHKTDAGVDRYWHVTQILCLGPSSGWLQVPHLRQGGQVIFFPYHQYDVPASQQPGTDSRGLHLPLPSRKANRSSSTSCRLSRAMHHPSFNGFFIHDEALARILENERREAAQKVETVSPPPALPEIQNIVEDAIADTEIPSTEQQPSETEKDENIYDTVEQMPEFPEDCLLVCPTSPVM